ncbi:NADAR family protein [Paenibacillus sp. PR3]|uniref:NADAR family protein n=1 Tax=Paenibacillus terricola TaxID=2763503 RepID=A0ABR8MR15_9BACL|nr:NADAR family protein [Paenibacillus terricola]MBD3918432.1 NADAR family protein [Paenibacillus terricola]
MIYNLTRLRQAYTAGEKHTFLLFWGHTPSRDGRIGKSCFSQWWNSPFEVEGVRYSCTEQYMMAEKARLFKDNEVMKAILKSSNPKEMKALGRAVRNFNSDVWDRQCYEIVKRGNLAKFSQNPSLRDYLISTRRAILVEASPYDRIWGIGMGEADPNANNPMKWKGSNLLGFALTEIRDQLLLASEVESI